MRSPTLKRFANRSTLMLTVAVIAGMMAAWAARQHIRGQVEQIESRARVPEVERVVAAFDLPQGTVLGSAHLAVRRFPASMIASDSLPPHRHAELEGQILRSGLAAGDPVLPAHVERRVHSAFSTHLQNGRRAITMPVDEINSVSGLLAPGDLIDLYVSFEYQRRRITAPLLQGVLVLATGTATQHDHADDAHDRMIGQGYSTVTLDAAPEDAVKLVAARQGGSITAILRNPADMTPSARASRGDLATLLGIDRKPPAPPARRATVLYGNTSIRSVPRLRTPAGGPSQPSGLFDMPSLPELASAWRQAAIRQAMMSVGGGPAPDQPTALDESLGFDAIAADSAPGDRGPQWAH